VVVSDVDTGDNERGGLVEESMDPDLNGVGREPGAGPCRSPIEFNLLDTDRIESGDRLADPAAFPVGDNDMNGSKIGQGPSEWCKGGAIDAVVVGQQDPGHAKVSALP